MAVRSKAGTRRKWISIGAVLIALLAVLPAAARSIGRWLIVEDAPQRARALVVLGGHLPFRAMEAAEIYRQGWSREVWITQGRAAEEKAALEQLHINVTEEHEYSRQVLERQGVPASAIRILPERNNDTADEIRTVAAHLRAVGGGRVIVVTSKFHTRRVKRLWHQLATDQEDAIVRYTPDDRFDPARWWRTTRDGMAVVREYFGMLNAWAGFPVKAVREPISAGGR